MSDTSNNLPSFDLPDLGNKAGLQIAYSIQETEFGMGIFAAEQVTKGTLIWIYSANVNVIEYDALAANQHLETLSPSEAKLFLDATYGLKGQFLILCLCRK